jgi:membrane-associated phospholipid phosphatase
MQVRKYIWTGLVLLTLVLILTASHFPKFPGDVEVSKVIQSVAPKGEVWAKWVTATAKAPLRYILFGITFALAWVLGGWRAALLLVVSFVGVLLAGPLIKSWIARPRPSSELIHVVGSPSGFSMPSTFAMVYGSTLGFIALLGFWQSKASTLTRLPIATACCILLFIGAVARIVLGGHWPSDMLLSYLICFLWISFLMWILSALRSVGD